jgi:hypothetical protein
MTINLTTEQLYFGVIIFLGVLQIYQWYYILNMKRQLNAIWSQIASMALIFYSKEAIKNAETENKKVE